MNPPPSYNEVIGMSHFNLSFCWKCGKMLDTGEKESNQCSSCRCILVQNHNNTPFQPPYSPYFTTTTPATIMQSNALQDQPPSLYTKFQDDKGDGRLENLGVINTQPKSFNSDNTESCRMTGRRDTDDTETASTNANLPRDPNDMSIRINNRLIIDFEKVGNTCLSHVGLDPRVKDCIPIELKSKGITEQQWSDWMNELHRIQKLAPSVASFLCMYFFPGLCVQAILCGMFCPISYNHPLSFLPFCYGDWYERLRQWQRDVNKVLNTKFMHAKLMTYKPHAIAPPSKLHDERVRGKFARYEMSFLVISLTKEESERLIKESWDHGVNETHCTGIGRCV